MKDKKESPAATEAVATVKSMSLFLEGGRFTTVSTFGLRELKTEAL